MSGLEALSLVCNIMTLITFAGDTVRLCKEIYEGKSPDDQLVHVAQSLESTSRDLQLGKVSFSSSTAHNDGLASVARKCNAAARSLIDEVDFVTTRQKKGSVRATLRVAATVQIRKYRLTRLEASLNKQQTILQTELLASIWYTFPPS